MFVLLVLFVCASSHSDEAATSVSERPGSKASSVKKHNSSSLPMPTVSPSSPRASATGAAAGETSGPTPKYQERKTFRKLPPVYRHVVNLCREDYEMTTRAAASKRRMEGAPEALPVAQILERAKLKGVPEASLKRALSFVVSSPDTVLNRHFAGVLDYSKSKVAPRLWVVNLVSGDAESFLAGQGLGRPDDPSDLNGDGIPDRFSSEPDSFKSSTGCILVGLRRKQSARVGPYFELHGLDASNSTNCLRRILAHGQTSQLRRVGGRFKMVKRAYSGDSHGCINMPDEQLSTAFARLGGGGIICTSP